MCGCPFLISFPFLPLSSLVLVLVQSALLLRVVSVGVHVCVVVRDRLYIYVLHILLFL